MPALCLGLLTLVGEAAGEHIHVTVRGVGGALCGNIMLRAEEWLSLHSLTLALTACDVVHLKEIRRLDAVIAEMRRGK